VVVVLVVAVVVGLVKLVVAVVTVPRGIIVARLHNITSPTLDNTIFGGALTVSIIILTDGK